MLTCRAFVASLALLSGASLAQVGVSGVEGALRENVVEYIDDEPACDVDQPTLRRYVRGLPEHLRPALEAFGHYEARIETELHAPEPDCWRVDVTIEPGDAVVVAQVSLDLAGSARDDPRMRALFEAFPLSPGSVLLHGEYLAFKNRLEALARERGYLDARFAEERIDVFVERSAAEIRLAFDSGLRYDFGETRFDTDALSERVLGNFVGFSAGEPYNSALVAQLQRELTASEYFANATVVPQIDDPQGTQIPIVVETMPAQPTSYSVGAGFSTDDGPRFRFLYENRRRNRAGHQMSADLLLALVRQTATFDYRIPVDNPLRDWVSLRAGLAREDIDAGVGAAARLGIRRTHVTDALTRTRFVDLLFEKDEIAGRDVSTRMLLPGLSWARSVRDDLIRPRTGHRLSAGLTLGIGRDVSLVQFDLRGKWITAFPWDARVIMRGRIGATIENEDFAEVPLSLRFFAGGDNSIRGYDYESLGPRNANGELIGGNRILEGSIEYEHPVRDAWAVALFVDAGNAFLERGLDARKGAGIGARWFSPIGPVRVDIAWPLDVLGNESRSPQLHISLGPDL